MSVTKVTAVTVLIVTSEGNCKTIVLPDGRHFQISGHDGVVGSTPLGALCRMLVDAEEVSR
jgi:hypothetical protein